FEQRPGLAVSYARTGAEGLLLAQQSPPDLILLDMRLPDMDGHQVYAQLQQDARTRGVPVIACSASAYAEDIRQALSEGLAGYLI
ncbi:response regulator, partial [Brucella melitensis]